MARFVVTHTVPPRGMSLEQVNQLAQAAQNDPVVRGYRSFMNLSEGKAFCVMDAPNKDALSSFFRKYEVPFDSITQLEYEGDAGKIKPV